MVVHGVFEIATTSSDVALKQKISSSNVWKEAWRFVTSPSADFNFVFQPLVMYYQPLKWIGHPFGEENEPSPTSSQIWQFYCFTPSTSILKLSVYGKADLRLTSHYPPQSFLQSTSSSGSSWKTSNTTTSLRHLPWCLNAALWPNISRITRVATI